MKEKTLKKIQNIQEIIHNDIGKRGISNFVDEYGLLKTVEKLNNSNVIGIITGFCTPPSFLPETDGPLGCFSMVKSFLYLKKKVVIITDKNCEKLFVKIINFLNINDKIDIFSFPIPSEEELSSQKFENEQIISKKILDNFKIDYLISIERCGPAKDNKYHNMGGIDISHTVGRTEKLIEEAKKRNISFSCIGDGGNELGMGNFIDSIEKFIPKGQNIGCVVKSDHVIVCGVSNWGGYGVSAGLFVLKKEDDEKLDIFKMIPTVEEDRNILKEMISNGDSVDGIKGISDLFIDGMAHEKEHSQILNSIYEVSLK